MKKQIVSLANNNSIWAIAFLAFRSVLNILFTPYITSKVGLEAYGYVSLANNFVMYIDIICVAFNYFGGRNIAVEFHNSVYESANRIYSSILCTDFFLLFILGGSGAFLVLSIERIINISPRYIFDVKILFWFVLIKYFLTLFGTTLEIGEVLKNRLDISSKNKIISYFAYAFCIITLFSHGNNRISIVGLALTFQAVVYLILQYIAKRQLVQELVFDLRLFSLTDVKACATKGIWISFNNLGNILNDGLDLLITNLMISESMVGMISIAKMIGNLCYSVIGAITSSMSPKQLEDYSKGSTADLLEGLNRTMKINGIVFCSFWLGVLCCGKDFIRLWLGFDGCDTIYNLVLLAMASFIVPSVVKPLYYVYVLTQNVRLVSYITIIMGCANTLSMYLLIKYTSLGGYAVLLTTAVLNLIHLVDAPIYAAYCLKMDWKTFYKPIFQHMGCCILATFFGVFIMHFFPEANRWTILLFKILVCVIPPMFIAWKMLICGGQHVRHHDDE